MGSHGQSMSVPPRIRIYHGEGRLGTRRAIAGRSALRPPDVIAPRREIALDKMRRQRNPIVRRCAEGYRGGGPVRRSTMADRSFAAARAQELSA
jgi:hypothetical protein